MRAAAEPAHALELVEVQLEPVGLAHVRDGVLERVGGQQQAFGGEVDDRLVLAVDVELHELDLQGRQSRGVMRSSNVVVGSTSGEIAGGPWCVPASIAARCSARRSAVRRLAMISQSANASVPAT